jgi:hypothetical protein
MSFGRSVVWVAALCLAACSSNGSAASDAPGSAACTPLEALTSSVVIDATEVLGAGTSADGTIYAVVAESTKYRLFVSAADGLAERFPGGTGEVNDGSTQTLLFDYTDSDGAPVSLQLRRDGSGVLMGVLRGPRTDKVWDIESEGEPLTPSDGRTVSALSASTTQTYSLDYAGTELNGDAVVIVAPDHADNYDGFRLFWGPLGALSERRIATFIRGRGLDGATNVTFAVDTGSAVLRYSFPYPPSAGGMSTGALTIGSESAPLSGAAPPLLPDGAQFLCR